MTERMYYDDPYTTQFRANITRIDSREGKYFVYLDRSYFYPTSGGQPYDRGTIGGAEILDVIAEKDGDVCHVLASRPDETENVFCKIDAERRKDHMQQHAGEHMIAGAIYRIFGGETIGLHLGENESTIDVTMPDGRTRITDEEILLIEDEVNKEIQNDVPIRCWFTDEEELVSLPLRKPPTVKEHVRIVQIGEKEYCACGGTHPKSAGEIALVKIVDVKPSKGKMRVAFVCGMRAVRLLQRSYRQITEASGLLTTSTENVAASIASLQKENHELHSELKKIRLSNAFNYADEIWAEAETANNHRVIIRKFENLEPDELRALCENFSGRGACLVFLASENGVSNPVLASDNTCLGFDLGKMLRECGGKGGGKNGFAQGSCADADGFLANVKKLISESEEMK